MKRKIAAIFAADIAGYSRPPMPPTPWFIRDPSIEQPLVADDVPLVKKNGKATIAQRYGELHKPKVLVIGALGGVHFYSQETVERWNRAAAAPGSHAWSSASMMRLSCRYRRR